MFKFEGITLNTPDHAHLMRVLGDLTAQDKEVYYEEYVEAEGPSKTCKVGSFGLRGEDPEVIVHDRLIKCRGHAIP